MDLKPQASLPPSESRYEYQVVAVLRTGDNNLYITDSRDRALMVFTEMNKNERYYKQVYIQVGVMVFDNSNLGRLP